MKTLQSVKPTDEQLKLMVRPRPGTLIIRGAAGSGKTTTSILMMKLSIGYFIEEFNRRNLDEKIKIRIFTFNKTLAAYITDLVQRESFLTNQKNQRKLDIEVTTLSKYMHQRINGNPTILSLADQAKLIKRLSVNLSLSTQFIIDEVEYLLGRLNEDNLEDYINMERSGRGSIPRVEKQLRREILEKIVQPYMELKRAQKILDWNDIAILFSKNKVDNIHIAILDETQDFSANQLKAITNQLAEINFTTIILDSNQKIYKRGFAWREAGIDISNTRYSRLEFNYRNTVEIANFANSLIKNSTITIDDDGTLPIIEAIKRHGSLPKVIEGRFKNQLNYVMDIILNEINLETETVAFLHAKGGGWFDDIITRLNEEGIPFIEISGESFWPPLDTNIALSTIHSAKGLEFDHVFILGLEDRHFSFSFADSQDSDYASAIKLISMGITRAKSNIILGYKYESKPFFINLLEEETFFKVTL